MTDIVLGTIIGGAIALLSGVAGYFLQGYFSLKNTRMQIGHQKEERREARLIEFRSKYLGPTRDCVLECCEAVDDIENGFANWEARFRERSNGNSHVVTVSHERKALEEFRAALETINNAYDALSKSLTGLQKWRHQVSDLRLIQLIGSVTPLFSNFGREINSVVELICTFESSNEVTLKYDLSPLLDQLWDLRGALIMVNYRIEEVMTGSQVRHNSKGRG